MTLSNLDHVHAAQHCCEGGMQGDPGVVSNGGRNLSFPPFVCSQTHERICVQSSVTVTYVDVVRRTSLYATTQHTSVVDTRRATTSPNTLPATTQQWPTQNINLPGAVISSFFPLHFFSSPFPFSLFPFPFPFDSTAVNPTFFIDAIV